MSPAVLDQAQKAMVRFGPTTNAGVLHKSGLASTKTHIDEPFRSNSPYRFSDDDFLEPTW
eukprot:3921711-Pleurochrysis_carterae.AAC.2